MIKLKIKKRLLLAISMAKKCEQLLKKSEKLQKKNLKSKTITKRYCFKEDLILENEIYKLISKKFKNDSFLGEKESGLKKKI